MNIVYYFAILVVGGQPTPFPFLTLKDACKAWYIQSPANPNKIVWALFDQDNGQPGRKKFNCGVAVQVSPPKPASYMDYPATEE